MRSMKRNRLRMLVAQHSITQPGANQLWREYLRGIIPTGKITQSVNRS